MIKLFSQEEYEKSKSKDLLPLQCEYCGKKFLKEKKKITYYLKIPIVLRKSGFKKINKGASFCSVECVKKSIDTRKTLVCKVCKKEFVRSECMIKKSKNHFCSRSCAATYNNLHKTTGNRRSKLEMWIANKLSEKYPEYRILFNSKKIIGSELDYYIPELRLAIELNGIYHYEPIHGNDKFEQIQNNDKKKIIACYEQNIELLSIDSSKMKYFKENDAQRFFDIIIEIVEHKRQLIKV